MNLFYENEDPQNFYEEQKIGKQSGPSSVDIENLSRAPQALVLEKNFSEMHIALALYDMGFPRKMVDALLEHQFLLDAN